MIPKNFLKFFISMIGFYLLAILPLNAQSIEDLQREFTEFRFGAFFHFGIRTFTGGSWGEANQDVNQFNPTDLDCNQWAEALVAAKMKFGFLTTKHHDGFCLWDSEYTENDVASSPWKSGRGDVVEEYVEAFRTHGLEPSLYYSVWDNTAGVGNGPITASDMEMIKGQITELLSDYGDIKMLFIDGWSWKMGHKSVPYQEIHTLVKDLQPGCMLVDNTHLHCLYNVDMIHFEAGSPCPEDNTLPAILSLLIYKNSGNSWFWDNRIPTATLMSVNEIVEKSLNFMEPRWCSLVLNCPPNKEGRLDNNIVARLAQVGQVWSPDTTRPPLPPQGPQIQRPITPVSAKATSGNAGYAIDGYNDRFTYTVWQTTLPLPQNITIDLGEEVPDVAILSYVPKYIPYINPLTEGSIKSYTIYKSSDNINFTEIASGEWNGDTKLKIATFIPTNARYIRLETKTAVDNFAAATEIAIGRKNLETGLIKSQEYSNPSAFVLEQNYPNPFNPDTVIRYQIHEPGLVHLDLYNTIGQRIMTLVNEFQSAEIFDATWSGQEISGEQAPSGIYFYTMRIKSQKGFYSSSKKMILLR